ncbi:MAG: YnbE family lipoprotein [Sphingomonadaceae bacterium]
MKYRHKTGRVAQYALWPSGRGIREAGPGRMMIASALLVTGLGASLVVGGCVSVNAPDKPIVIELNINIRQEVIYRLAKDAGDTIDENADIF